MAQSIEQARQEVQSALTSTLAWANTSERRSFAAFEARRWTLMLTLGRALVRLFLARQAARPRSLEYRQDGRTYRPTTGESVTWGRGSARWSLPGPWVGRLGIGAQQRICSWTASCPCARVSPWAS